MLEFIISEVTCQGDILQKSKEYRLRIVCKGSVKQLGDNKSKSQWIKSSGGEIQWVLPDSLAFTLDTESSSNAHGLLILLERRHVLRKDEEVGRRLLKCATLESVGQEPQALFLKGAPIEATVTVKLVVTRRQAAVVAAGISSIGTSVEKIVEKGKPWPTLFSRLNALVELGDQLAELNPIAKLAWGVVKMGYDVVSGQIERDAKLTMLTEAMARACSFAEQGERLDSYPSNHRIVVGQILQQVVECTYFVRAYCEDSFGKRILKNMSSDDAGVQIDEYISNLAALQSALDTTAIIECTVVVHRVFDEVAAMRKRFDEHGQYMQTILADLSYADEARPDIQHGCLPGTRVEVVDELVGWGAQATPKSTFGESRVNKLAYSDTSRVIWVCGLSGSGKSSIARTVAARLNSRLGSIYAFNASNQIKLNPSNLFSTIARNLADYDPVMKRSLVNAVQGNTALRKSQIVSEQFEEFILAPSSQLSGIGCTVIVIDAFDESSDAAGRQTLLSILTSRASEIPPGLKFIVTSRFEPDVQEALEGSSSFPYVDVFRLDDVSEDSTSRDIGIFIHRRLGNHRNLRINSSDIDLLVEKAEQSFQWASTACNFILDGGTGHGETPRERLRVILNSHLGLDKLYTTILQRSFSSTTARPFSRLKNILGVMTCAMEPLPLRALITLSSDENEPSEDTLYNYQHTARYLGSLITGAYDLEAIVKPLHASFAEFLRDETRSGDYSIDQVVMNRHIARRSLEIMVQGGLKFNICNFPSSFLLNRDVKDLDHIISSKISASLSYSCRYWSHYIAKLQDQNSNETEQLLLPLFRDQLLFWLEVMSLVSCNPYAALITMSHIVSSSSYSVEVKRLVEEATRLTLTFLVPIMESVPHIYISCLPFIPTSSRIPANLSDYSKLAIVRTGQKVSWDAHVKVFDGHSGVVRCVAYAPVGTLIASGSDNGSVQVWNHSTGELMVLRKHTRGVKSVAFSPDAKQLISGSDDHTLILWDLETCRPVWEPLAGHSDWVQSVAFSPMGDIIASGSHDKTIRLWDASTGQQIGVPLKDHKNGVRLVSFSPDGSQLLGARDEWVHVWDTKTGLRLNRLSVRPWVSSALFSPDGSYIAVATDKRILRFDAITGSILNSPFCIHNSHIVSISFSAPDPTGYFELVSFSKDRSIRFWDPCTGLEIRQCLYGHTNDINSVAYSPDGEFVVSGSRDGTVRLWSRHYAEDNTRPLEQHSGYVTAVAYSPDGGYIATGSGDIRIWKADDGNLVGKLEGVHADNIWSVVYSPDGKHLASGSDNNTIQLWDVETLTPIGDPLLHHTDVVYSIAFSPDGTVLVSGSGDSHVGLWDMTASPPSSRSLAAHTGTVSSVAFSPKGTTFASGSHDMSLIIWDAKTGIPIGTPIQGNDGALWCVTYSPDGTKLAAGGDRYVTIWDVEGRLVVGQPFIGHSKDVLSVAFSPSGEYFASGSKDKTVCVWDVNRGLLVGKPLQGHTYGVSGVTFSPNGDHVVSISDDGTVRVWDMHIDANPNTPAEKVVWHNERQYPSRLFPQHTFEVNKDGWIVNIEGEPLLWVPHEHRPALRRPYFRFINNLPVTELDFEHFKCGMEWARCCVSS